jgi:hypothetical protein
MAKSTVKSGRLTAAQLLAATPETQQKYLGQYITAVTVISGANRDQTSTTFNSSAGPFIPPTNIILTPQNPIKENVTIKAGRQTLKINVVQLIPPNPEQEGYVTLDATFTDIYGSGEYFFVGVIANWNLA